MTLEEGIIHAGDVARMNHEAAKHLTDEHPTQAEKCEACAEEHRQLAEWLKELKAYKEQGGDAISRQAVLDIITFEDKWLLDAKGHNANTGIAFGSMRSKVSTLPSVNSKQRTGQRTGRWIPVGYDGYADGNPVYDWWECSECGWEHTGDEESLTAFCPNCGAKMEAEDI